MSEREDGDLASQQTDPPREGRLQLSAAQGKTPSSLLPWVCPGVPLPSLRGVWAFRGQQHNSALPKKTRAYFNISRSWGGSQG